MTDVEKFHLVSQDQLEALEKALTDPLIAYPPFPCDQVTVHCYPIGSEPPSIKDYYHPDGLELKFMEIGILYAEGLDVRKIGVIYTEKDIPTLEDEVTRIMSESGWTKWIDYHFSDQNKLFNYDDWVPLGLGGFAAYDDPEDWELEK